MARRRRQSHEEPENLERWLVSYADFITLLFAFFVVMYSVSSVNEGKFRVLSDAMVATFKDPRRSMDPIQVGELVHVHDRDFGPGGQGGQTERECCERLHRRVPPGDGGVLPTL